MSTASTCIEIKPTPELTMAINEFNRLIPDPSGINTKSRSKKQYGGRGEIFCHRLAKVITFAILAGVPATLYLSGVAGAGSVFLTQLFKDYIAGSSFAQRSFIDPTIARMRSNLEDIAREDVGVCSEGWISGSIDTIRSWGSSLFGGNDCNQKNLMYVNRLDELVAEVKAQLETNYAEQASMPTMGAMTLPLVERIRRYSRNLNEQVYNILKASGLCDGPKQTETPLELSVKKWIAGSIGPDDLREACGAGAGAGAESEHDELDITDADEEESAKMLLEMRVLAELENYDKHTDEEKKVWETALQQGEQLNRQATAQIQKIETYKIPEEQREEKVGGVIHGLRSMLSGIYKTAIRSTPERSPLRKSFIKTSLRSHALDVKTKRMTMSPDASSEYFSQDESPNDVPYITNPPVPMVVPSAVHLMPNFPTTHYLNKDEIDEIVEEAVRKSKRKRDESTSRSSSSSQKYTRTKRSKRFDTKPSRKSRKLYVDTNSSRSKRKTANRSRKPSKTKKTLY